MTATQRASRPFLAEWYNGKRAEIGFGPASSVSLATARRIAGEMHEALALGQNVRGRPRELAGLFEAEHPRDV